MARPKGSKVPKAQQPPPSAVTIKLTLDPETARALRLQAFAQGCSVGQVVASLVALSPTRYVLTERQRSGQGHASQGPQEPQGGPAVPDPGPADAT